MTEAVAAGEVRLSFMVLAELQFGAEKARRELGHTRFVKKVESLRDLLEVEPLGESVAPWYARVRCQLEGAGIKIGDRDTLIAAHALALGGGVGHAQCARVFTGRGTCGGELADGVETDPTSRRVSSSEWRRTR